MCVNGLPPKLDCPPFNLSVKAQEKREKRIGEGIEWGRENKAHHQVWNIKTKAPIS